jgi:hypothetical protein
VSHPVIFSIQNEIETEYYKREIIVRTGEDFAERSHDGVAVASIEVKQLT